MECENCNKRFAEGFKKGQESVLRKNKSGCCCIINDDDEVVSACGAHKEWLDRHLSDKSSGRDKDLATEIHEQVHNGASISDVMHLLTRR